VSALPLSGHRVLELAHLVAGPVCGMYLGDLGADVVKVEDPRGGDISRTAYTARHGDTSAVFLTVNRNKRSLALDLARDDGRRLFLALAARADVVIEGYRGGVAERLGIDYDHLAPLNPRLVYCSVSAFGPAGPWRDKPGVDMLIQAMGGLMAVTGEPDGVPVLCGAPVVDTMGALLAGQAVVTALLHRERTGAGQRVDVSLLGASLLAHAARLANFLASGEEPPRLGSAHAYLAPFRAYHAADGAWIYVAVLAERLWAPFCDAVERPDLAADPRFATNAERCRHRGALDGVLVPIFARRPVAEWMEILGSHGVLCARVNGYGDLVRDPQVVASGLLVDEVHPRAGRFTTLATPARFSATPGTIRASAPALGEHTDEILGEAGIGSREIAALRAAGVVA
jgi:crotonobetainyl-CoA:carnitine CoA-transferase CaiB-like acyl-CoA transferase